MYPQMPPPNVAASYGAMPQMMPGVMAPMTAQYHMPQMAPHMNMMMMGYDYTGAMYDPSMYDMSAQPPMPETTISSKAMVMEDLAMLGIDAEDVGAGGF